MKVETLEQLLQVPGIVLRQVPLTSSSLYAAKPEDLTRELGDNESLESFEFAKGERKFLRVVKPNSLGGKWLVTVKSDQYSTVNFSQCGVDTCPIKAYNNYTQGKFLKKRKG